MVNNTNKFLLKNFLKSEFLIWISVGFFITRRSLLRKISKHNLYKRYKKTVAIENLIFCAKWNNLNISKKNLILKMRSKKKISGNCLINIKLNSPNLSNLIIIKKL